MFQSDVKPKQTNKQTVSNHIVSCNSFPINREKLGDYLKWTDYTLYLHDETHRWVRLKHEAYNYEHHTFIVLASTSGNCDR